MTKVSKQFNTGYDQGFDKGFNSGFNIGYETGYNDALNKTRQQHDGSDFQALFQRLPSSLILSVNQKQLYEAIDNTVKSLAMQTLNLNQVSSEITEVLKKMQGYLLMVINSTTLKNIAASKKDEKASFQAAVEQANVLFVPSVAHVKDMFLSIDYIKNNFPHKRIAPLSLLADFFRVNKIREFNKVCAGISVYDNQAEAICLYLGEQGIVAGAKEQARDFSLALVGEVANRYELMLRLQEAGKVVIDCTAIRTLLTKRLLPIGIINDN